MPEAVKEQRGMTRAVRVGLDIGQVFDIQAMTTNVEYNSAMIRSKCLPVTIYRLHRIMR